jgi:hypothetical protein
MLIYFPAFSCPRGNCIIRDKIFFWCKSGFGFIGNWDWWQDNDTWTCCCIFTCWTISRSTLPLISSTLASEMLFHVNVAIVKDHILKWFVWLCPLNTMCILILLWRGNLILVQDTGLNFNKSQKKGKWTRKFSSSCTIQLHGHWLRGQLCKTHFTKIIKQLHVVHLFCFTSQSFKMFIG